MAEFRRNRGGLESGRGPQYRQNLLPWEHQFCESLGITEEEYFEFYELVAQYRKEEAGRELIPDVRCDPVSVIVSVVIGAAISAVSMLLAPKPRAPEERKAENFQGSDVRGRTKYAPLNEFGSVQELATLGSVVPLIYADWEPSHGGVRVDSQMMWSRMVNKGTYQVLEALMLFGAGDLWYRPNYKGYALGDSKLTSYPSAKIGLFFSKGPEATDNPKNAPFTVGGIAQYSEGKIDMGSKGTKPFYTNIPSDGRGAKMIFCGVVTPSQSAVFGQYTPIRNGQGWKYPFKYPGKGSGDKDKKEMIYGTRAKHVCGYHSGRTSLVSQGGGAGIAKLKFTIRDSASDRIYLADERDDVEPEFPTRVHFGSDGKLIEKDRIYKSSSRFLEDIGGMTEGINGIDQSKIDADTALEVGELYLIGAAVYRCTNRNNLGSVGEGTPFEPGKSGSVEYFFTREPEFNDRFTSTKYIYTSDDEQVFNETHIPIQKVSIGSIGTTRAVNSITMGIKSTVYRQVNGYPNIQEFTGPDQVDRFSKTGGTFQLGSTVAYYGRMSLFRMEVKINDGSWIDVCGETLFAVYGSNPQPAYNRLQVLPSYKCFMQFRFVPVCGNAWIANGNYKTKNVMLLEANRGWRDGVSKSGIKVRFPGRLGRIRDLYDMDAQVFEAGGDDDKKTKEHNQNPNSLLQDYWFFDADTASHANEPEHSISYINEYVENSNSWYANENKQYENLAYAGLVCQSSKEISTFSSFSAYFEHGIEVERLYSSGGKRSTSNFPEIAYDLLTNRRYGVGEFIGNNSIDKGRLTVAAKFCRANGFYWDGVISQETNLREFMYSQAAFQLLDFEIRGGQFSLYPSVPFNSDYTIDNGARAGDANFPIKALFTDGNVRNYKTTMLSPEERQLFVAEMKYRKESRWGFPETRVTRIRLADKAGGYKFDPKEVFDCTQFMTTRDHAIKFAKSALRLRQVVDHSVTFETTPDAAHTLSPGDYIRVGVSAQHNERNVNERLRTGSVAPDGTLQYNEGVSNGTYTVFYWKPGFTQVRRASMRVSNGMVSDSAFHGSLFTVDRPNSKPRIYKVETISFTEESFVEITASHAPVDSAGRLKVLNWNSGDFVIEDND